MASVILVERAVSAVLHLMKTFIQGSNLIMFGSRQAIIVYLHTLKQAKMLRKFGNIHFVSKKLKYVVLYTNMADVETLVTKLSGFSFVKKVEVSYKPYLKMEFENARPDKAKEYDYKMGI